MQLRICPKNSRQTLSIWFGINSPSEVGNGSLQTHAKRALNLPLAKLAQCQLMI